VHTYHTRVNTNLRDRPALNARALVGAGKGNALRSLCPGDSTEHWLKVQDAQGRHGWVLRSKIA
jgi:uncharacterized protein YgiM (DUF1202 family)